MANQYKNPLLETQVSVRANVLPPMDPAPGRSLITLKVAADYVSIIHFAAAAVAAVRSRSPPAERTGSVGSEGGSG